MQKAIGFYWTLPVKWTPIEPFDPRDIEQAAKSSKTIAMQRAAIRRWCKENGCELIHEAAYLELQPDRALPDSEAELLELYQRAEGEDAWILYVDFSQEIGWRRHLVLEQLAGRHRERFKDVSLHYEDQERFRAHFSQWRSSYAKWLATRPQRIAVAVERAEALQSEGLALPQISEQLNSEVVPSITGKMWTPESLRKFLKKYSGHR